VPRLRHCLPAVLLTLAACGGGDRTSSAPSATAPPVPSPSPTATATPPTASAPSAPTPPPDAPTPTRTATPGGESQPGGAGDESAARIPVAITVGSDGTISPQEVSVPAFFALGLEVRNRTAGPLTVRWDASEPSGTFQVGAGKVGSRRVNGVKPGRYPLTVSGAGTATIVSGSAPGP
jgi:hypothetical protein